MRTRVSSHPRAQLRTDQQFVIAHASSLRAARARPRAHSAVSRQRTVMVASFLKAAVDGIVVSSSARLALVVTTAPDCTDD